LVPWHRRDVTKFYGIEGSYTIFYGTGGIGSHLKVLQCAQRESRKEEKSRD